MYFLIVNLLLLSALGESAYTHIGSHMTDLASHPDFHEHVHNHTALHICKSRKEAVKGASEAASKCVKAYVPKKQTWCHFMENDFKKCLAPLVKEVRECFPDKSKDVPQFVVDEMMSVTKYICKAKGKDLLELTNPCIHHSVDWETNVCISKILEKLQAYQKEPPTKAQLCEFITEFRVCFDDHLKNSCRSKITRDDFLKLYDALLEPCKSK